MDPLDVWLSTSQLPLLVDQVPSHNAHPLSDFELHYDVDNSDSVIGILRTITQDLSSHRSIHNWDEKLVPDSVKDLAKYANRQLSGLELRDGSAFLRYSLASEVCVNNGISCKVHAHGRPFPKAKVSSLA